MRQLSSCCRRMSRLVQCSAAAFLMGTGYAPSAWAQGQIFVTNYTGDSITVYPRKAAGDVAPSATIAGQLGDAPHLSAINHGDGELIVANNLPYSIAVYDLASGALKRTISGPSTGLVRPTGVAVDEVNRELYVANDYGNSITVYDILAAGDAPPKRSIQSQFISAPSGLAIDLAHDEIVVASQGYHALATYERLSTGAVSPKRLIFGFSTGLNLPQGVALDLVNDEIVVASSAYQTPDGGAILAFRRTDEGDVFPLRKLEGNNTKLCNPFSVALDHATGEMVVANANFGSGTCLQSVTTYSRTAAGNTPPKSIVGGVLTALEHPVSAAITSASGVVVKMKPTQGSVSAGASIGYSISATVTGGPIFDLSLTDSLPAGLTWSLGGPDASSCSLSQTDGKLTCSFDDLAKGAIKTIHLSAPTTSAACPGVSNRAVASFNNGVADVSSVSPLVSINIRCK
jgi:DNA-binding beta-propeller fold protein YncE